MINIRASIVLSLRDAFTGRALGKNSVLLLLDGERFRPEYHEGGWFVFLNLEPGMHEITVRGEPRYRDERITVEVAQSGTLERIVGMKPSRGYPLGNAVRVSLTVTRGGKPAPGERVYLAVSGAAEMKLSQDVLSPGDNEAKFYFRGNIGGISFPAQYLIADKKTSELCVVSGIDGTVGAFEIPVSYEHKRGTGFYPCTTYLTDDSGMVTAYFASPATLYVTAQDTDKLITAELTPGENTVTAAF